MKSPFPAQVAQREAELINRVDAYVLGVERALNGRRSTLLKATDDVETVRRTATRASEILVDEDAQLLSVTAAVAKRLSELRARLGDQPLRPPHIDANALRFEVPQSTPLRILNLVGAVGAVLTPDDPVVEPAADDDHHHPEHSAPPPPPQDDPPPVELVVHALRPKGTVGQRVNKLLKLKHAHDHPRLSYDDDSDDDSHHKARSPNKAGGQPDASWPYARGGGGGATFQTVNKLKHKRDKPDVDSFVVDVQTKPDRAQINGSLVARVVVVTTTDPKLKELIDEQRRVETLPNPPTMRLLRTLNLRSS